MSDSPYIDSNHEYEKEHCPYCRQGEEIERLRTALAAVKMIDEEQQKRIEKLEANDLVESQLKEIQSLNERIEELEIAIGQVLNMRQEIIDKVIAGEHCHIITSRPIVAAWKLTHRYFVEEALAELGIVRCEGCGGEGTMDVLDPTIGSDCPDCAEWGSEGFVIGGEDE